MNCYSCGRPAVLVIEDGVSAVCERCEERYQVSMHEQFPFGQCQRCGCRFEKYTVPCTPCLGLGEVPVISPNWRAPSVEWIPCNACSGTGETFLIDGPHDECVCGIREGWWEQHDLPTKAQVLEWTIEEEARKERDREYVAATGDIPF